MSAVSAEQAAGEAGLSEADFRGCRWIEGNPTPLRPGMFCCAPTLSGGSWCARHRKIVWAYRRGSRRPEAVIAERSLAAQDAGRRSVGRGTRHERAARPQPGRGGGSHAGEAAGCWSAASITSTGARAGRTAARAAPVPTTDAA